MSKPPRKPITPARMLWLLIGAVFLFLLTGAGLLFAPIWDIEEPSFPALEHPPRPVIADEDNAYPLLLGLDGVFTRPPEELKKWLRPNADEPTKEELRQLSEYLASQEHVITTLRQALARPYLLHPEIEGYSAVIPYSTLYLDMGGGLLRLRLYRALREDDTALALDTLRLQYQFATKVLERPESLIDHLIGTALCGSALENSWLAMRSPVMSPSLQEEIPSLFPSSARLYDSLILGLRSEFKMQRTLVRQIVSGELLLEDLGFSNLPALGPFFKPNKTLFLLGSRALWNQETIERMKALDFSHMPAFIEPTQPRFDWLDMENAAGRFIDLFFTQALGGTIQSATKLVAEQDILRVWLALRGYHRLHGQYPATLDELVPAFLEAVPVDRFDGKPLRYDAGRAQVWSVGPDGRDDGGKALRRPNDKRGDLVFGAEGRLLEDLDAENKTPPVTVE
jgi:hypothetical protein